MAPPVRRSQLQPIEATEVAHLTVLAGDVIQSLPVFLSRQLSDLKELDAVLSGSAQSILKKFNDLLGMIADSSVTPLDRLKLLRETTEEANNFKLGAEDKIRVATGTCETVLQHSAQMDLIVSLLTSLMPEHLLENLPASTTPAGYPHLFPSYISSAFATAQAPAPQHARARQDFFSHPVAGTTATRQSQANYAQAVATVDRYRSESNLPPVKPARVRPLERSSKKSEFQHCIQ